MMRVIGSIALCIGVGCGGSGGGGGPGGDGPGSNPGGGDPGGVTGTLGGVSFSIQDAISASIAQTVAGQTTTSGYIWMSNTADICGDIDHNRERPMSQRILIGLADSAGTAPTGPGTYPVNTSDPTMAASFATSDFDATCETIDAGTANATGGTVTLTAVTGDVLAGTFDVTFDSGDHLTGSFAPTACPDLQMVFSPLYGTNCM